MDFLVDMVNGRSLFDLIGFRLDLADLLEMPVEVVTANSLRYIRDRVLAEAQSL